MPRFSIACALGLAVLFGPLPSAAGGGRMPIWPTEVSRVAAPLLAGPGDQPDDRARVRAIGELDPFATAAIAGPVVYALEDPSVQVRREALRLCYERAMVQCVPLAVRHWKDGREATLRVSALRVIALEPNAERAALLREALRDPGESVRAQAAEFLGWAPLAEEERTRAKHALLAKLADVSAVVRRHAVDSLGLLGGDTATLAVARLLDDPEPAVRAAAAGALGRLHDDRAVPALRRALDDPNEPLVTKAIVRGLAQLGGEEVDADLLLLLDDPPSGLDTAQIADAIGRRPQPGAALVEGLVDRLNEPGQRDVVLELLQMIGAPAHAQLEQARDRGVEPALRAQIDGLLGVPATSLRVERAWPDADDRSAWRRRLEHGADDERLRAGVELGRLQPGWLGASADAAISDVREPDGRRGWLVALAVAPHGVAARAPALWMRLVGWGLSPHRSAADRCLAIAAASAATGRAARSVHAELSALAADPSPTIRGCAIQAAARLGVTAPASEGLVDPIARVRAASALALADPSLHPEDTTIGRLAMLRARDTSGHVRAAAAFALQHRTEPASGPGALWMVELAPEFPWTDGSEWVELERPGTPARVWAPAVSMGRLRLLWAPALGDAAPPE